MQSIEERKEYLRKWKKENSEKIKGYNKRWYNSEKGKELHREYYQTKTQEKRMYERARDRAVLLGRDFNIELSDIVIPTHCSYLGIELVDDRSKKGYVPSIDRIDNSKGYIKGNIQIISMKANEMKRNKTHEDFLNYLKEKVNDS